MKIVLAQRDTSGNILYDYNLKNELIFHEESSVKIKDILVSFLFLLYGVEFT